MIVWCFALLACLALAMPIAARAHSVIGRDVSITVARIQVAHVNEVMQSRTLHGAEFPESDLTPGDEEQANTPQGVAGEKSGRQTGKPFGGTGADASR